MARSDGARVTQAIRFLEEHWRDQPELAEVAAAVGLSGPHFQRLFKRWAGVSPKRFLQYLTAEHARRLLEDSSSVLDAAYDAGLSGPGRLHDLTVNVHALSPGELRRGSEGVTVRYGFHPSPFGECLLAEDSARAAVATFGATIELSGSKLECNPIDLNGEVVFDEPFALTDLGGNLCGCDGHAAAGQVLSSGLSAPDAM